MRGKDLLECMEYIDDELVEEALEPIVISRRRSPVAKWGMAAACVIVLGISATAFWSHQNVKREQIESAGDTASPIATEPIVNHDSGELEESVAEGKAMDTQVAANNDAQKSNALTKLSETGGQDISSVKENAMVAVEECDELKKTEYTVIRDYSKQEEVISEYLTPEKGKVLCAHSLQKTMEYYAEQETTDDIERFIYVYEVVIEVFGDVESADGSIFYQQFNMPDNTNIQNERIEQEYRRLIELGYAVRLSEDFQITGTFTKVEIDTFQAAPEYGYVFRFESEG